MWALFSTWHFSNWSISLLPPIVLDNLFVPEHVQTMQGKPGRYDAK